MTAFLALRNAVADALEAAPALAGVPVRRGRAVPLALGDAAAIYVNLRGAPCEPLDMSLAALQWQTTVTATVVVRAGAGQDAETAADPVVAAAWDAVAAMPTPAGTAKVSPADIRFEVDEAEHSIGAVTLIFNFNHVTTGAGLTA